MADKYLLNSRVVEFGGTDISGKMTNFEMKPTQGEAGREEVSDKASFSAGDREYLTTLRGDKKTAWSIEVNDEVGGVGNIWGLSLGNSETLIDYPEGKTHGKRKITLANAVVSEAPAISGSYQNKATVKAAGYSFSTPTTDTYSSV